MRIKTSKNAGIFAALAAAVGLGGGAGYGLGSPLIASGGDSKAARPFGNKLSGTKAAKKWRSRIERERKFAHWGQSFRYRAMVRNRQKRERNSHE